jgi:hypothetical protein
MTTLRPLKYILVGINPRMFLSDAGMTKLENKK